MYKQYIEMAARAAGPPPSTDAGWRQQRISWDIDWYHLNPPLVRASGVANSTAGALFRPFDHIIL